MQYQSHISLNKLATKLNSYAQALIFLARTNDIPLVEKSGVRWVRLADVPRLTSAWEAWRARPRLADGMRRRANERTSRRAAQGERIG
jgi:hypothetical protein